MGFFKWSRALVFSGELVQLDNSSVVACVKSPKIFNADSGDESIDRSNENIKLAVQEIEEKFKGRGITSVVYPDSDGEPLLSMSEKMFYIPRFGYLAVNTVIEPFLVSTVTVPVTPPPDGAKDATGAATGAGEATYSVTY